DFLAFLDEFENEPPPSVTLIKYIAAKDYQFNLIQSIRFILHSINRPVNLAESNSEAATLFRDLSSTVDQQIIDLRDWYREKLQPFGLTETILDEPPPQTLPEEVINYNCYHLELCTEYLGCNFDEVCRYF